MFILFCLYNGLLDSWHGIVGSKAKHAPRVTLDHSIASANWA
jgi:hypothetical protein